MLDFDIEKEPLTVKYNVTPRSNLLRGAAPKWVTVDLKTEEMADLPGRMHPGWFHDVCTCVVNALASLDMIGSAVPRRVVLCERSASSMVRQGRFCGCCASKMCGRPRTGRTSCG